VGGTNSKRWRIPIIILAGVALTFGIIYLVVFLKSSRKTPVEVTSLESWLTSNGYDLYKPLRNDMPPGSLIKFADSKTLLVMTAQDLYGQKSPTIEPSAAPDVSWQANQKFAGAGIVEMVPGLGSAGLSGSGVAVSTVELKNLETVTIPLDSLQAAVQGNAKLKDALAKNDETLLVVVEAIRAGQVECNLTSTDGADVKGKLDAERLKAAVGSNFEVRSTSRIVSTKPVYIGFKAAKVTSVAKTLGGPERELKLEMLPLKNLQELKQSARAQRLHSRFRVFALAIGQGNYPYGSERTGGELPGAIASANLVANNLRQLASHEDIQTLASRETSSGDFDTRRRLTKAELEARIDQFIDFVRSRSQPGEEVAIIYYYFGHGLAEGISRSVYLVPEAFKDDASKNIADVSNELISVAGLRERFLAVTDNLVFLIDSCRSHRQEDKELLRIWSLALGQNRDNIASIVDALQFMSGIYGPSPILFGSADGLFAATVQYATPSGMAAVGPVAARLDLLFKATQRAKASVTPVAFVRSMQEPAALSEAKAVDVRAYTALRDDFLKDLPAITLVGTSPTSIAMRRTPYQPPVLRPSPSLELPDKPPPSGVLARKLNVQPLDGLSDFARLPDGSYFLLDSKWNLWKWPGDGRPRTLVRKELHFPQLGSSAAGDVYLNLSDDHTLHLSVNGGEFRLLRRDSYPKLVGQSCDPRSALLVDDDNTVGTKDDILRLQRKKQPEKIGAIDASGVFDVIEFPKDVLVYTTGDDRTIYRHARGESKPWITNLSQPSVLTASQDHLYCIERSGPRLYRVGKDAKTEVVDLRDTGIFNESARDEDCRGFHAIGKEIVLILSGTGIYELDLKTARWELVR
jgi:hypothetical protein